MTLFSATVLLFLVLDPFGNIPFFVAALTACEPRRHSRIIARELLIALGVLLVFLFSGRHILQVLGISEPALTVAGGIVLFLIAVRMVFPAPHHAAGEEVEGEPFIVPLAVPYVAGPSALASVLLIMSREPERWPEWLAALLVAWTGTGLILSLSGILARKLGKRVLVAIERLMGMILVAIAVQMVMTGVGRFLDLR
ncbi:MAG: NAAT family transporter [Planctomycetes bacterium]|nr:NAAT family transporter [Planctomycetota bacterium]